MRKEFEMMLIVVTCSIVGFVLAMIIKTMYDNGVIFDELISGGITVTDVMLVVTMLWMLIGVIISVLRR